MTFYKRLLHFNSNYSVLFVYSDEGWKNGYMACHVLSLFLFSVFLWNGPLFSLLQLIFLFSGQTHVYSSHILYVTVMSQDHIVQWLPQILVCCICLYFYLTLRYVFFSLLKDTRSTTIVYNSCMYSLMDSWPWYHISLKFIFLLFVKKLNTQYWQVFMFCIKQKMYWLSWYSNMKRENILSCIVLMLLIIVVNFQFC